jgi:hypothetical protein
VLPEHALVQTVDPPELYGVAAGHVATQPFVAGSRYVVAEHCDAHAFVLESATVPSGHDATHVLGVPLLYCAVEGHEATQAVPFI